MRPSVMVSNCKRVTTTNAVPACALQYLPDVIWEKAIAAQIARIGLCLPSLCSPEDVTGLVEASEYLALPARHIS